MWTLYTFCKHLEKIEHVSCFFGQILPLRKESKYVSNNMSDFFNKHHWTQQNNEHNGKKEGLLYYGCI